MGRRCGKPATNSLSYGTDLRAEFLTSDLLDTKQVRKPFYNEVSAVIEKFTAIF
jgi:hypothetical protein